MLTTKMRKTSPRVRGEERKSRRRRSWSKGTFKERGNCAQILPPKSPLSSRCFGRTYNNCLLNEDRSCCKLFNCRPAFHSSEPQCLPSSLMPEINLRSIWIKIQLQRKKTIEMTTKRSSSVGPSMVFKLNFILQMNGIDRIRGTLHYYSVSVLLFLSSSLSLHFLISLRSLLFIEFFFNSIRAIWITTPSRPLIPILLSTTTTAVINSQQSNEWVNCGIPCNYPTINAFPGRTSRTNCPSSVPHPHINTRGGLPTTDRLEAFAPNYNISTDTDLIRL